MFKYVEIALNEYKDNKSDNYSSIQEVIAQDIHTRRIVVNAIESSLND